jgi:hypothetical protein
LVLSFELKKKAISVSWKSLNKIEKPYLGVFVQALFTKNEEIKATNRKP